MAEASDCCSLISRGSAHNESDNGDVNFRSGFDPVQGYDYEFYPPLDPKYECPICLLCQRDPTQTSCGHRFCKACILTWIRMEGKRCPEDNSPLTEHDLFPDNFAKREIMSLGVKCPNGSEEGCHEILELGKLDDHLKNCEYQLVPCPNECSLILPRHALEFHCANDCLRRTISCKLCCSDFPLTDQQIHFMSCPMVTVPCDLCLTLLPRQHLQPHLELDCPKTIVSCPFSEIGCKEKMEREALIKHEENSTHHHLQLLTAAFRAFQFNVGSLLQRSDSTRVHSSMSVKEKLSGETGVSTKESGCIGDPLTLDGKQPISEKSIEHNESVTQTTHNERNSIEKIADHSFIMQEKMLPMWNTPQSNDLIRELFQRNVQLEQKAREQELKLDALRTQVTESQKLISSLEEKQANQEIRFCNGVYYWRVNNFSRLRAEATRGQSRVLHSVGFYTSCFGYKVCLRLNVQGKNNSFVSLFIHLMKGEYDNMLNWPFMGKITLTILDQDERTESKLDITETMLTKPGLTAFRKPTTERNPKGFGYTEFVSMDTLLSGRYIRNDQIIIRAVVTI